MIDGVLPAVLALFPVVKVPVCFRRSSRWMSDVAGEGVAAARVAAPVAGAEPLLSLRGGAVGPGLAVDPTLELLLDPVVADGSRSVEPVVDVALGDRPDV